MHEVTSLAIECQQLLPSAANAQMLSDALFSDEHAGNSAPHRKASIGPLTREMCTAFMTQ